MKKIFALVLMLSIAMSVFAKQYEVHYVTEEYTVYYDENNREMYREHYDTKHSSVYVTANSASEAKSLAMNKCGSDCYGSSRRVTLKDGRQGYAQRFRVTYISNVFEK